MSDIEFFSHIANIVTVIVFLFSAYQFFLWRKQNRYSLELDALLNMEICFEVFISELMRSYAILSEGDKYYDGISIGMARELARELAKSVNVAQQSYDLARFKVIKLNFKAEDLDVFKSDLLRDRFEDYLRDQASLNKVAEEVSLLKKSASSEFKKLRAMN